MRRLFLVVLCLVAVLSGCSNRTKQEEESMKNYETFVNAIITNKGIESKSIPFDYTLVQQKQSDGSYQYEVRIYNPRVAMYDIQAIAVDQSLDSNMNVYPCLGLLGKDAAQSYYMIPFQSNPALGYVKLIGLNGISREKQFTLNVLVSWKDAARANTYKAFFNCSFVEESADKQEA